MGDLPWRIGRFEIVAEIGRGAHATVYQASELRGSAMVAVKVATVEGVQSAGGVARYLREAEMVSRLEHPRINRIHEVGEDAGRVFFVEELCTGGDLGAWLDRHPGPLDPRTAAGIVRELASAVAFAHDAHVVHRAIMPANVLLVPALGGILGAPAAATGDGGGDPRYDIKLTGFRLGTLSAGWTGHSGSGDSPAGSVPRSSPPLPPGTLAWLAPEQVDPSVGGVGPATDVHGLGLVLHRLLTGRHPAAGRTDAETLRRILFDDPPAADAAVRGVPAALAAIDLRCRAKDPRRRYAHAAEVVDDLSRFLAGRAPQARPPSWSERVWRRLRRRPLLAPLLVLLPLLTLAGVVLARQQRIVSRQRAAIRSLDGANEMRRGFEAWHAGRVPDAIERSRSAGVKSQRLAGGIAGRWLRRRIHGEEAMLVPPPARPDPAARLDLYCLMVSPGGDRIAAGRADGTLVVCDCDATGNPVGPPRTRRAHDEINDVAFSPDGRLLVTAGQDGRVCIWRSDSLALVAEITAGERPLYAAAFSPDGARVAWGGDARVVSVATIDGAGMPVGPIRPWTAFQDHPAPDAGADPAIDALVFTDADSLVAVAGSLMLSIDARDGSVEREFVGPKRGLGLVTLAPDGQTLITGGRDGVARLWSVASGELVRSFPQLPGGVHGADVAPDGTWIVAGCRDGVIRVFDVATGAERNRLIGHAGRTWDVRCDRAGRILSTGEDGSLRRWQPTARFGASGLRTIELPAAVWHVVPDAAAGRVLAISSGGSNAWIDPLTGGHGAAAPLAIDGQGRCVRSPWDATLVGSGVGGGLVILPGGGAGPRHLFDGASLGGIAWTGRGTLVTSVAEGDAWRIVTVTGVTDSPSGTLFVNGDLLDDVVEGLAAAPVATPRLAIATGSVVRLLTLDGVGRPVPGSSRTVFAGGRGRIVRLAWSPDGARIACGDELGRVRVVDPWSGAVQTTMSQLATGCGSLAWSADGESLVTADRESVRLGDGRTGVLFDEIRPGWQIHSVLLVRDVKQDVKRDTALVIGGAATDGTGRVAVLDLRE